VQVPAAIDCCPLEVDGGLLGKAVLPNRCVASCASVEAFCSTLDLTATLARSTLDLTEGERRAKSRGDVLGRRMTYQNQGGPGTIMAR
jgi:hypothetical protein